MPIQTFIRDTWRTSIVPALREYIAIPNESPAFDSEWREHGHMDRAVDLFARWAKDQKIPGMGLQVARAEGRTPLLCMEIPGSGRGTVLLYGHLDKQPPVEGWRPGLGPWTPVLEDGKLYGRGGADDGYGMFAALTAIKALQLDSFPARAASSSSRRAKRAAASTSPTTWTRWRTGSARRNSSSAWTPAAAITNACGSPRRCAA